MYQLWYCSAKDLNSVFAQVQQWMSDAQAGKISTINPKKFQVISCVPIFYKTETKMEVSCCIIYMT